MSATVREFKAEGFTIVLSVDTAARFSAQVLCQLPQQL